ncbi:acyl-CoA dehydrogenase [Pseudomonas sp. P1B16]|uniref:Acyl-CoA dehydrogenase n=1 Tax=Pseudomonas capeferrum TaxID=1495066 RepID=A0ABY7R3S5_9PSED|nr:MULTISPECIES: acyl-CoA dehydrogenase [Pseudomonas]MBC3503736.1 acyl-CoA dehydrogenase [Pseudomonas sp. SWRI59]MBC3508288.1 acyl-CoA dehydrogenase [Pseudomonas sp. SWRI68]MUT53865.1 acyl-CoA dehydrogenase [Pseudomonas sp. TDA1]KGI92087.1 acyl-CoA dehydrogenase [Pseudomonas sp. H2]MDD2066076.1 acyl-CoA dehydrogenase [Pseudomonas sp. 25571]
MHSYRAPLQDIRFVIDHWLQAPAAWAECERFAGVDSALAQQLLEEGARFAEQQLVPLNRPGDREGCRFQDGHVSTPTGFRQAYQRYVDGGWPGLACAQAHGGQGLPLLLGAALHEVIYACNHGWAMYSGIAHGAYECLRQFGSAELRQAWLGKIVSGECLPTMCLTEPQAGSDVGLLRTQARVDEAGAYRLTGNKVFISGGEHDLTDNILHLVLARLPDAPAGSRGISLFLVPKLTEQGRLNGVHCTGIEHKMGIHASATCSLSFDQAEGWLVGEPQGGLAALFVMMNSARTYVGLQGLAHAESAGQRALAYAQARLQMRAVLRPEGALAAAADPVAFHPAVRQVLWQSRAMTEGMRAIGYWSAHLIDLAEQAQGMARQALEARIALLTPVVKAFFTEQGFQLASDALQVFGGYGYVTESGIEQTVRDSRVAMIYEGTNEIQANDLLLRKVLGDGGEALQALLAHVLEEAGLASDAEGMRWAQQLRVASDGLQAWVGGLVEHDDQEYAYRAAGDFLQALAMLLLGHAWARSARLALVHADQPFYRRKRQTAAYFFDHLWLRFAYRLQRLHAAQLPLPFVG